MASKIFTLGNHGYVSAELAEALGISTASNHRQARILVVAPSKADAFVLLAARDLAPLSVTDKQFRQAMGNDVDFLAAQGLLSAPTVLVHAHRLHGPVFRVDAGGGFEYIGSIGGIGGRVTDLTWTSAEGEQPAVSAPDPGEQQDDEERQFFLAKLAGNRGRMNQVQLERRLLQLERQQLAREAYDRGLVAEAAAELGLTPARIGQLRGEALVEESRRTGTWVVGQWVEVTDTASNTFNPALVVDRPPQRLAPNDTDRWVWVEYTNGSVCPVRYHRVAEYHPMCSECPPKDQPRRRGVAALNMHIVSKHGGMQ